MKNNNVIIGIVVLIAIVVFMNNQTEESREVVVEPDECSISTSITHIPKGEEFRITVRDNARDYCNVYVRANKGIWNDVRVLRLDSTGKYSFDNSEEFGGEYDYYAACDGGCETERVTVTVAN